LGINVGININNRRLLNEILDDLKVNEKNKENVIREIDKLDKLPESEVKKNLKKFNAEKVVGIFKKPEKFFEKYEGYKDIKELKKLCKMYGVSVNFQPFLARGLSYYNWIVFEVKGEMKETICAGGSYNVNGIQASGMSFGLDRLELLSKVDNFVKKVLIISLGQDKKSIEIANKIRNENVSCEIFYGKPGKALGYADSKNIPLVIFVGDEEVKKKKYKIKNMDSGNEKLVGEKDLIKGLS
jgi:histidyl-tRNA synthetase